MSRTIVTGIATGFQATTAAWDLPQRLEWEDFKTDTKNVTLYVKALQLFMNKPQSEPESFFQIAGRYLISGANLGIHGLPHTSWEEPDFKPFTGYCHHGGSYCHDAY
jgi:hypothetical protein